MSDLPLNSVGPVVDTEEYYIPDASEFSVEYEVCSPEQCDLFNLGGTCPASFGMSQPGLDNPTKSLSQNYAAMMQTESLNPLDHATCEENSHIPLWQESIFFAKQIIESGDFTQFQNARESLLVARHELISLGADQDSENLTFVDSLLHEIAVLELSIMSGNINGLQRSIIERQQTVHGVLDADDKMGFTQFEAESNMLPPILGIYETAAQLIVEGKVNTLGEAVDTLLNLSENDLDPSSENNFAIKYGFAWSELNELRIHVQDFRKLQQDPDNGWITNVVTSDPLDKKNYLENAKIYHEHALYSLAQYNYDLYFHDEYVQAQEEASFEEYLAGLNTGAVNTVLHEAGAYEAAENLFGERQKIYAAGFMVDFGSNVYTFNETTYADLYLERLNNAEVTNSDEDIENLALVQAVLAQTYNKFIQKEIADNYKNSFLPDAIAWKAYDRDFLLTDRKWYEFEKMTAAKAEHFWRMLPIELATLVAGGGLGGAAGKGVAKRLLVKQLVKKGLGELAEETLERGGMKALYVLAEREMGVATVNSIRIAAFGVEAEVFSVTTNLVRGLYTGDLTPLTNLNSHFKAWGHSALMLGLYKIGGAVYRDTIGVATKNLPTSVRMPADLVGSTVVSAPIITGGEFLVAGIQGHALSEAEFADLLRGHIVFSLGLGLVHAGSASFENEPLFFKEDMPQSKKPKNGMAFTEAYPSKVYMHAGPDPHPLLAKFSKWVNGSSKAVEVKAENNNVEGITVAVDNMQYNLSAEAEFIGIGKKPGNDNNAAIRINAGSNEQCWLQKIDGGWYLKQSSTKYETTVKLASGEEVTLEKYPHEVGGNKGIQGNLNLSVKLEPGENTIKVGNAKVAVTIPGMEAAGSKTVVLPAAKVVSEPPVFKIEVSDVIDGKVPVREVRKYVEKLKIDNFDQYSEFAIKLESEIYRLVHDLESTLQILFEIGTIHTHFDPQAAYDNMGTRWQKIVNLTNLAREIGISTNIDTSKIQSYKNQIGISFESNGEIQVGMPQIYKNIASDPNLDLSTLGKITTYVTDKHNYGKTVKELQSDISIPQEAGVHSPYSLYNGKGTILGSKMFSEVKVQKMALPPPMEGVIDPNVHGFQGYIYKPADAKVDGRLYITIKPEKYSACVGGTVNMLQLAMKESNGAFWFKVIPEIMEDGSTVRRDQIVVYFNHENQAEVLQSIQKTMGEVADWHGDVFSDKGPYFTAKIQDGLFFGQEPSEGLGKGSHSFGTLRADVLELTKKEVKRLENLGYEITPELEMAIAAHLISKYEIDPEHPAFNAGGTEIFNHIYENIAADQGGHVGG